MSAFVKITCINTIGVDSAKSGNETHFISFVRLATSRPWPHGGGRVRGMERATRATKSRVVDLCRLQEFKSH
jgi:hypothetical protein